MGAEHIEIKIMEVPYGYLVNLSPPDEHTLLYVATRFNEDKPGVMRLLRVDISESGRYGPKGYAPKVSQEFITKFGSNWNGSARGRFEAPHDKAVYTVALDEGFDEITFEFDSLEAKAFEALLQASTQQAK